VSESSEERAGTRSPLEVRVGELKQLFNAMDPAPFRERDLDPNAVDFIVDWARELPAEQQLELIVQLGREPATPAASSAVREAVHEYFGGSALAKRRELRHLLRVGRKSLLIGVLFVAAAIGIGDLVSGLVGRFDYGRLVQESVVIGAWVALWRPLEIFLYDWWPLVQEARLYDRLAGMPVRVVDAGAAVEGDRA
jgi:hypothetical protein